MKGATRQTDERTRRIEGCVFACRKKYTVMVAVAVLLLAPSTINRKFLNERNTRICGNFFDPLSVFCWQAHIHC